jgi:hypothetical protein
MCTRAGIRGVGHTAIELCNKPVVHGVYASERLRLRDTGKDCRGIVMVANRTREMRLSGMKRGAYGNVDYGHG